MVMHDDRGRDRRWWRLLDHDDPHEVAMAEAVKIADEDARRQLIRYWRSVYYDEGTENVPGLEDLTGPIRRNVVRNAIDALHARMLQAQPAVDFKTQDGDFKLQQKAKKRSLFVDGEFERLRVDELYSDSWRDALIEGDAIVMGSIDDDGRPCFEQAPVEQVLIPLREQKNGQCLTAYYARRVDKEVLAERFPAFHDEIMAASVTIDEEDSDADDDDCTLVEAWRLPVGKMPGRRLLFVSTATLEDEDWKHKRFPWARLAAFKRSRRYWSQGLAQRMFGAQLDVVDMASKAHDVLDSCTVSYWLQPGHGAAAAQLEDRPGRVYTSTQVPVMLGGAELATPFTAREDVLVNRAYEDAGISQLSASSLAPTQWSGKAQIVHQDVESVRFKALGMQGQRFVIDMADLLVWLCETHIEEAEDKAAAAKALVTMGGDAVDQIAFGDGDMERDRYRLRTKPQSMLSRSTAARIQEVLDMMGGGLIDDPDEAREMLEMPDLERFNSIRSAGRDAVRRAVQQAIDGKRTVAHGALPLDYAITYGTLMALKAEADGAPRDVFDRVMAFVAHAKKIKTDLAAQQQAAQQAAMGPPPVPPAAAPPPSPSPAPAEAMPAGMPT